MRHRLHILLLLVLTLSLFVTTPGCQPDKLTPTPPMPGPNENPPEEPDGTPPDGSPSPNTGSGLNSDTTTIVIRANPTGDPENSDLPVAATISSAAGVFNPGDEVSIGVTIPSNNTNALSGSMTGQLSVAPPGSSMGMGAASGPIPPKVGPIPATAGQPQNQVTIIAQDDGSIEFGIYVDSTTTPGIYTFSATADQVTLTITLPVISEDINLLTP